MIDEINFNKTDYKITAKIDNEEKSIDIYEIDKFKTHFFCNDNLNTILNEHINVNIGLGYVVKEDNDAILEEINFIDQFEVNPNEIQPIDAGTVTLSIMDISEQNIYDYQDYSFKNGIIKTEMTNQLPIGEYILKAEYVETKFFKGTTLKIHFNITRRKINCIFTEDTIQAYPNEQIKIDLNLLDTLNNKKIKNCIVRYSFYKHSYITQTDDNGYAQLIVRMPKVDPSECISNSKLSYDIEIAIDSNIYDLTSSNKKTIFLKKYKTEIAYTVFDENEKLIVEGDINGYVDNNQVNVIYGTVNFSIDNVESYSPIQIDVDEEGHFGFETEVIQIENANVPVSDPGNYSLMAETNTEIVLLNEEDIIRNYNTKNKAEFQAIITDGNKSVEYGMISFVITQKGNEVYRYVTEVNSNGEAFFYFDVSTLGDFDIQAFYHGIFNYKSSKSQKVTYKVKEGD